MKCEKCGCDNLQLMIRNHITKYKLCQIRAKCWDCSFDETEECSSDYVELCKAFDAMDFLYRNVVINKLKL